MIVIWAVYTMVTLAIFNIAAKKPLPPNAPRHARTHSDMHG